MTRSLHPNQKGYDPDMILTLGEVPQQMLKGSRRLGHIRKLVFGTHRRIDVKRDIKCPKKSPVFLVLPEGVESESIYLFDLALACAKQLPDASFIFRLHPVLPFKSVEPLLTGYPPESNNVEVSNRPNIEDDFERSGYILYRGSSTVMYAILIGLKPYYYHRTGEINFDPIFELNGWRDIVRSPEELIRMFQADRNTSDSIRNREWQVAFDYCDRYAKSVQEDTLDQLISMTPNALSGL